MSALPSSAPTVLVVDDNADARELMTLVLEDAGFSVWGSKSAGEAVDFLLSNTPPHLVISDLVMPGHSGRELLKFMRDDGDLRYVPVIVVTAQDVSKVTTPADAIIQKPMDLSTLVETARRVIRSSAVMPPASGGIEGVSDKSRGLVQGVRQARQRLQGEIARSIELKETASRGMAGRIADLRHSIRRTLTLARQGKLLRGRRKSVH